MTRWEPDARGRLEEAALALYAERGYEQTTVAEIAARAGLTERTFFRYFADKREVLFGPGLQEVLADAVAAAPASAAPLDSVAAGLVAAGAVLQGRRAHARKRQAVIVATPALQERELMKMVSFASAMAAALRDRGTPAPEASLAAEAGIAVFRVAFERWVSAPGEPELAAMIRESLDQLRAVAAGE